MDRYDFIQTWIALEAGAALGQERLRAFYTEAGRRGINVAARQFGFANPFPETPLGDIMERGRVAAKPAPSLGRRVAGTLVRRSPYVAAGYIVGKTAAELEVDDLLNAAGWVEGKATGAKMGTQKVKKKVSKFNKAVSKAMKAVKKSKFMGKPNTFTNPKKAFGSVTKTVARAKKGAKLSAKGATGTIKRAIKGLY